MTYHEAGFVLIPLHPDSKRPARAWKQYQHRRPERSELGLWWPDVDHVPYGFGLVCGNLSGVTVIDADGPLASAVLLAIVGEASSVPLVRTAHGWHAYFRFGGERNRTAFQTFSDGSHLDRRGEGGYVVLPPTPGKTWHRQARRADLASVPPGWARSASDERPLVTRAAPPTCDHAAPIWERAIPAGQRHDTFVRIAGGMVRRGASPSDIEQELVRMNSRCRPPFTLAELAAEIAGIVSSVGGWSRS
jgi:hypothetical protein